MRFDMSKYEPVEDRLRRMYADHPDARVLTDLVDVARRDDGMPVQYIVRASVLVGDVVMATGYAEEIVGSTPVNKTSALENCETSAVGRALANWNYAPKGARPSREEMAKVATQSDETPVTESDDPLMAQILGATTRADLTGLVDTIAAQADPEPYRQAAKARWSKVR